MEERSVTFAMAMAAARYTYIARERLPHCAAQRATFARRTAFERALPPPAHAFPHCIQAVTPHKLQHGLCCSSSLGSRLRNGKAFGRHVLASFLAPVPAAALHNSLHNCCLLLLAAICDFFVSNMLLHNPLAPLLTLWSGPHPARMRVAACRRAPHAAWHVSENWLQPHCTTLLLLCCPRAGFPFLFPLLCSPPHPCFFLFSFALLLLARRPAARRARTLAPLSDQPTTGVRNHPAPSGVTATAPRGQRRQMRPTPPAGARREWKTGGASQPPPRHDNL